MNPSPNETDQQKAPHTSHKNKDSYRALQRVALRYRAIYLDVNRENINMCSEASVPAMAFIRRLRDTGYCVSEELLHALNDTAPDRLAEITSVIDEMMGVKLNWAPLVKGWDKPTGESLADHLITMLANIFGEEAGFAGTTLPCGHLIPDGTFPLERYNGCPFCGRQFATANYVFTGQGSKLKELRLFTSADLHGIFLSLLQSPTPLDGTQKDTLTLLLQVYALPKEPRITMKETAMLAVSQLTLHGKATQASRLLRTPTDILRYLWYEKTRQLQIIEPRTLTAHAKKLYTHLWGPLNQGADAAEQMRQKLKLKYDRKTCRHVAMWMNALPLPAELASENMHPKRGMWVRMIHALRLGEYSRKKGYGHLAEILDLFYKQEYTTWQGQVDQARVRNDADETLRLLKKRPGLFARCLFSTMLRFGSGKTTTAFSEIADQLPARLLLSLGNAAETYFDPTEIRLARPITGVTHIIMPNKLLTLYSEQERTDMVEAVKKLYTEQMGRHFSQQSTTAKTIFIDPRLHDIPVSVGDRSTTIQDASCALMGTRFPIEGDTVRLFLQWGKGLHA